MSKCGHCHQKKGKRACPALSGSICPSCCGKHRQKEISCPPECPFVEGNTEYNTKKQLDNFGQRYLTFGRSWVMRHSESAAELLYRVDASSLAYYVTSGRTPSDQEMIEGWEYLLNRADSSLVVPGEKVPPFADFLLNHSNRTAYEFIKEKDEMKGLVKGYCDFIRGFSDGSREDGHYSSIHWKYLQHITTNQEELETVVREYTTLPAEKTEETSLSPAV